MTQPIFSLDNYDDSKYTEFVFFWHTPSPFSQWHPSLFEVDGVTFNTAEQWMMWSKAKLFGDEEVAQKILETSNPRAQKNLGRQVKNFNDAVWQKHCQDIVYRGNVAKFSQNKHLYDHLMKQDYVGKEFVESSEYDRVWGIGLGENNPKSLTRKTWRGKNWLGKILTVIRDQWLEEQ
jgi:ribA/ribD-fused uncharacterized protein